MTKRKSTNKIKSVDVSIEKEHFRFGKFFTVTIIAIWALIVLNSYFKSQPVSLQFLNIPDIFIFIKRTIQITMESFSSLLWMIGFSFIAYRIGEKTFNLFKLEVNAMEKFLFSTGLGLGILIYFTLLAGFAGFYYSLYFKIAFFILFVFSLWKYKPNLNLSSLNNYNFSLNEIIMVSLLLFLFFFNLLIAFTPENFYDALVYHLSGPNLYILHHKIIPIDYLMHSNFPLNINMLYTLALLIDNEILARLIHFYLTFLTTLTIFAICKKFYNLTTGLIASLIYYTIPILLVNSWGCGNDAGLSFFFSLSVFAFLLWVNSNLTYTLNLSAIYIGLTIGSKYTSTIYLFVLTIIIFYHTLKNTLPLKEKFKKVFLYNLIALSFLFPYLIKNYLFTHNPIYPFCHKIFGGENLYSWGKDIFSNYKILNFNIIEIAKSFWTQTISASEPQNYIGIIFLIFSSFSLLSKNIERKLLYLIWIFILIYPLWYSGYSLFRFLIPAFFPFSIFIAFYIEKLKRNFIINCIFYVCIFAAIFLSLNIAWGLKLEHYLYKNSNKDEFLSTTRVNYPNPSYSTIKWINENLPENSKILFSGENKTFYLKRDYITYSVETNLQPLMEYIKQSNDAEGLKAILKKNRITHILINYREAIRVNPAYKTYYWNERDRKIFNDFWQKYIKLVYFKNGAYLYSINENNVKKELNILEELEKRGWDIKNLHKIFEENKMWENLIDEYEDIAKHGYDVSKQLEILHKLAGK